MSVRFGPFEINEHARELLLAGEAVRLQPKVFDVLLFLHRHRDRVVGKEELLDTLWPGVIVTDASLQRVISVLRSALARGGWADAIETRSRVGYRFRERNETPTSAAPRAGEPRLLERDSFLAALREGVEAARVGHGRALFISGEAGIGKSSLVATFLAELGGDLAVLRGYCDALFTPRAFGAVLDLMAQLPEGGTVTAPSPAREEVFARLLRQLQALPRPAVLVLEDLHWADEATLDFVRFLGRRIDGTRCLLLATYREESAGAAPPPHVVLGDLNGPQVVRLRLPLLSAAAVAQLAASSGHEPERIFRLTGGNPFLVREIMSAPEGGVPESVRESQLARLRRCSPAGRRLCELVSLVPGRAEFELVAALVPNAGPALDEAIALGIIVHAAGQLSFRHELARQAVEDIVPPSVARRWHARLLRRLRRRRADVARLVHHARCAGDHAAILRLAPLAAKRAAELGSHREAAAHYGSALLFADEMNVTQRLAALEGHAFESYMTSQIPAAIASTEAALELWRKKKNRAAEGRSLRFLSRLSWFNGDRQKADRYGAEALAVLSRLRPSRDLAMAHSNLSQLAMLRFDVPRATEHGWQAVTLARRFRDLEVECHALNNIGTALLRRSPTEGRAELERSLELGLQHHFQEHAARAYVNLASTMSAWHHLARAREIFRDGLAYCEKHDLGAWRLYLLMLQAAFELQRGAWDHALELAGIVLCDAATTPISRIAALQVQALVHARRGLAGAAAVLAEAKTLAEAAAETQRIAPVAAARAEAAWLVGDHARAAREAGWGLEWAMGSREIWMTGELLFWQAQTGPIGPVPGGVAEPWRLALAGNWRSAAAAFAEIEMPYEQALQLAGGDAKAVAEARRMLTKLGARATLETLAAIR